MILPQEMLDLNNSTSENQRHQFGATNSADVKLRIFGPKRQESLVFECPTLRNRQQETNIRDLLSSLNLSVLPDLDARLNKQKNDYLDFAVKNVKEFTHFLHKQYHADDKQPNLREAVGKFIIENLQRDACSGIADTCRDIILEAFKTSIVIMRNHKHSTIDHTKIEKRIKAEDFPFAILWLSDVFPGCDVTTHEAALRILCEKLEPSDIKAWNDGHREIMVPFLLECLEALGNGKIVVERKLRVGFVTTWFPVMAELIYYAHYAPPNIKNGEDLKTRLCNSPF
ncbi:hypothetical protein SUGI_1069320 [Cryptomeria japonica]|nr:hypothetical protein SUGI_1069320 [Cryptomeria japonica]